MEAAAANFALDSAADVFSAIARAGCCESLAKRALGTVGQFAGFFLRGRDLNGDGGISVKAVLDGGEIELDEVARLDRARAGDAMDDFVVDADADVTWKIVDKRGRGLGAG